MPIETQEIVVRKMTLKLEVSIPEGQEKSHGQFLLGVAKLAKDHGVDIDDTQLKSDASELGAKRYSKPSTESEEAPKKKPGRPKKTNGSAGKTKTPPLPAASAASSNEDAGDIDPNTRADTLEELAESGAELTQPPEPEDTGFDMD